MPNLTFISSCFLSAEPDDWHHNAGMDAKHSLMGVIAMVLESSNGKKLDSILSRLADSPE